jgi:putative ABC transport system permease protein
MDTYWQDFRYALRTLFKSRGFSTVVLLTLTVGIGATVAMFSVLDAALGKALPFPDPKELVLGRATFGGGVNPLASFPDYLDYRDLNESFEELGALLGFTLPVTVTGTEEPERVPMVLASGNLFEALGVAPHLGRTFSFEESTPGGPPALLLSYGYWQRRFGASLDVLGQTVNVNGTPVNVVGVMPADFHLLFDADAWLPGVDGGPMTGIRRYHNWLMVGRLKPGVSVGEAQAEMDVISAQLAEAFPDSNRNKALRIDGLHEALVEDYRQSLFILMGAIVLVLLIACGNVASLLMARGSARNTEMAVRSALGAGRPRLIRQLLTESVLLSLGAGILGVLAAVWLQDLILGFASMETLGLRDVGMSGSMLGFALVLSLATALLFGVVPALATVRTNPAADLKEGGRGSTSGGSARLRSGLVVLQVALSVILLIGSGLLIRSFARLSGVDPGFETEDLLTATVSLPSTTYADSETRIRFFEDLKEQIEAIPGVESVALGDRLPIRNPGNNVAIWSPERPPASNTEANFAFQRIVMPGYFDGMGIPLISGRGFDNTDVAEGPRVIILNETAADTVFPGESALGRQVAVDLGGDQPSLFEVVGVVADHRMTSLSRSSRLSMFFPHAQRTAGTMSLAIRSRADPGSLVRPVQERLWAMDREIPLASVETMEDVLAASISDSRSITTVLGMFSTVALFLAALVLYGVLAYFVSRRVHEIGIRVALGAPGKRVVRLVLSRGMILVCVGLILGVAGAVGLTRLLEDLLFQTPATDVSTFAGVAAFFTLVALLACSIPAWRALRVDPMVAFRTE